MNMLFRKKIEKQCSYCKHAAKVDENTMVCVSKGLVSSHSHCGRFRYDPLKRIPDPPARIHIPKHSEEDYSL